MTGKDLEEFATGWVAGDLIDEATTDTRNNEDSGFGTVMFWGFIGFILFSIYAISGIEFSKIWSFLKIVTFPLTWDYQLLDFKLFGVNNYYSTVGSIAVLVLFYLVVKILDRLVLREMEGRLSKKRIIRFQPVQTFVNLISLLFDLFVSIATFYMIILIAKVMLHGFLSIFTFIFSI